MKAAEHQVAFWPYPQLLLAAHFQSPLGDLDHLADVRDVKRLIRLLLHRHAKPAHDQLVLPPCHAVLASSALGEAADHCLYQLMLQPTRDIGIADDFRGVLSQLPGHRMQPLKPCHRNWRRVDLSAASGKVRLTSPRLKSYQPPSATWRPRKLAQGNTERHSRPRRVIRYWSAAMAHRSRAGLGQCVSGR